MGHRRMTGFGLGVAILIATAAPSGAAAQVQVGQTAADPATLPDCSNASHHLQAEVATGPSYVVPSAGVITSWSHLGRAPTAGSGVLLVLRATATPNRFQVVSRSPTTEFTPGVLGVYPIEIPVLAGDQIGLRTNLDAGCFFSTGNAGDLMRHTNTGQPEPIGGDLIDFLPDLLPQDRVNVSATVAPTGPVPLDRKIVGFGYDRPKDGFKGKVTSSATECVAVKVTVFRRKGGRDRKIGSDKTDGKGKWLVEEADPARGNYYARAPETSTAAGICSEAKSTGLKLA